MCKYTEYIFNKINSILSKYIGYFKLYENYRQKFENIITIDNNIEIDTDNDTEVDSNIDSDDLDLLTEEH